MFKKIVMIFLIATVGASAQESDILFTYRNDLRTVGRGVGLGELVLTSEDAESYTITIEYDAGLMSAARAPLTTCRGAAQVCYTETIYHPVPNAAYAVMRCAKEAYGDFRGGVLCHNFAGQGCYKETI